MLALALGILMLLSLCTAGVAAEEFFMSENFAYGKKPYVNNAYSGASATSALDGNVTSEWRTVSSLTDKTIYMIIPFAETVDISIISATLYAPEKMTFIEFQYTTDPLPSTMSKWEDIKYFEADKITPTMTFGFDTVSATGIRFAAEVTGHSVGLYEIEVYDTNDIDQAIKTLESPGFERFHQNEYVDAKIVSVGDNGKLVYADFDGNGSTLIDYSYAGYKRGEEPIPDVKVVKTIDANYRDNHTSLIQNAINEVAALPLEQRGAILLKAGTYVISDTIKITASGIVLRGEGQGENGTVIYDTRKVDGNTSLQIKGAGNYTAVSGSKTTLVNDYVPMGQTTLKLSAVNSYQAGDHLKIICSPNQLWVQTLGMDVIPGSGKTQWTPNEYVIIYERVITAVDSANSTVTIDTGIPLTLDKVYYSVAVEEIVDHKDRITEVGVENLRLLSYYDDTIKDEKGRLVDNNHTGTPLSFSNCRNCWATDVTAKGYTVGYTLGSKAINVTVENCSNIDPVSTVEGGRRYAFQFNYSEYCLVKNCYSNDSRHDYVLGSKVPGPNVFLGGIAQDGNAGVEPHQRWSTGTLYDNIYITGWQRLSYIQLVNRGNYGSGHGWACANTIMWNCLAPGLVVAKPQTEQNFAVGTYGIYQVSVNGYLGGYKKFITPTIVTPNYPSAQSFDGSPMYGNGYIESPYNPVNPSSLYKAQLSYRLYGDATKNVAPCAPILNYPLYDTKSDSYTVTFSGVADINAKNVFVYVDGEKHEAKFSANGGNEYSLDLNLVNGYHDVYVTQVIDGIESDRNATRSFLVDSDVPYVPEADDKQETTKPADTTEPTETTDPNSGSDDDNKTPDDKKGSNLVLPIVIVAVCVAVGVVVFFVVKKTKKSK